MQAGASSALSTYPVLGIHVALLKQPEAVERINDFVAHSSRPRLVTFTNVHMVVEAERHQKFRSEMEQMDMNLPDGAPVFWLGYLHFGSGVSKISGPDFMPAFCRQSVMLGHRHFLFGGAPGVAEEASRELAARYPGIKIVGHYAPPFRTGGVESQKTIDLINASGADLIWVGLGCPKQEQWMVEHRHLLHAKVILAVGQAFDLLAGRTQRAPAWTSRYGLEWAYRLMRDPRRLWKRYCVTNVLFLYMLALSFCQARMRAIRDGITLSPLTRR